MFTQKKKEYYSKILGFKTIEDFEEFSKRYLKYLENQTLMHTPTTFGQPAD